MNICGAHWRCCGVVLAGAGLLLAAGCGGAGFGSELRARPKPQALAGANGALLRLPQDKPFSIALAPSQETPGLGGKTKAEAHASPEGKADAVARVDGEGSARAGFQLGHGLSNDSDRQIDLHFRTRCNYETEAEASPAGPLPAAKVTLRLYARDGNNRLLRDFSLAQHSSADGAAVSTDHKQIEFTLTLGPRQSVNVFLAGSVEVETRAGHSARGSIKLSGLEMEIETRSAPPVKKAGDEQS